MSFVISPALVSGLAALNSFRLAIWYMFNADFGFFGALGSRFFFDGAASAVLVESSFLGVSVSGVGSSMIMRAGWPLGDSLSFTSELVPLSLSTSPMASSVNLTSHTGDSDKELSFSTGVAMSDSAAAGVSASSMATVASSSLSLISSTFSFDDSTPEPFPSLSAIKEDDVASSTSVTISSDLGVFLGAMVASLPLSKGALFSTEMLSFSF
mmetsp:Transcript_4265/g.6374  ORF Transcript_4265/g.6374 Transcript_4265/m.6374 type:complete len:211 (+) Transcript_4265:1000-1632(+)